MRSLIQSTPAYQLSAEIAPLPHGHHLRLVSFVPTARRPEEQVRFQATLSVTELLALKQLIDRAVAAAAGGAPGEPVAS